MSGNFFRATFLGSRKFDPDPIIIEGILTELLKMCFRIGGVKTSMGVNQVVFNKIKMISRFGPRIETVRAGISTSSSGPFFYGAKRHFAN